MKKLARRSFLSLLGLAPLASTASIATNQKAEKMSFSKAAIFGDSMAFGLLTDATGGPLATDYLVPWAYKVAYKFGVPPQMLAIGATSVGQRAPGVYGHVPALGDINLSMPGRADLELYGSSAGAISLFDLALGSETYWLGGTCTKALGAGWVTTGTWVPSPVWGIGIYTATDGATIQIPFNGPTLAFGTLIQDGAYSSYSVAVDGVPVAGPIGCSGAITIGIGSFANFQPSFFRQTGFSAGPHIATVTAHCPASPDLGSNHVYIHWAMTGGPSGIPTYIVNQPVSGVAAAPLAGVEAYNAVIATIVANAQADGINIIPVNVFTNSTTGELSGDLIHPNMRGHEMIYQYVMAAIG
jgi:hypothetical protein